MEVYLNNAIIECPTEIKIDDETIWSQNSGDTISGKRIGEIIRNRKTFSLSWGVMENGSIMTIINTFRENVFTIIEIKNSQGDSIYRSEVFVSGSIPYDLIGELGDGKTYVKGASAKLVER